MTASFHAVFARAKAGEREAVEQLLARHLDDLRAFVRLRSGPLLRAMESQSDLVQTVCREALGDLERVDCPDERAFRSWLWSVAHNKLRGKVDYHRAQKRDPAARVAGETADRLLQSYGRFTTPSQHASAREQVERIEQAFDALPDELRRVLIDACLLGRSQRELAAELGITETAVRKRLSRARARLALLLDSPGGAD